ncbi:MAG: 4Fe-4S binding protein [Lachnospiraceae bacterium]|nr:4Fe-4S binding protein [Lachnospiraceae bacterium]
MDKKKRTIIQSVAALLQNANFKGFFTGRIYTGKAKSICVPGLNCYSCPAAIGACPIGSLQNALSSFGFKLPYYVIGLILFFGAVLGRLVCGFLCPFGLLQDLLNKIPFPFKLKKFKADRYLRILKYAVLIILVIVLPICVKLTPFFCKYLCPSGTLAGILLAFSDTGLFRAFGSLFAWKACVLGIVVLASVMIARPFCKYLCPLGAIYAPLNKVSVLRLECDRTKCISCGKCAEACDMGVDPSKDPNSPECIRCLSCVRTCPVKALGTKNSLLQNRKCKKDIVSG